MIDKPSKFTQTRLSADEARQGVTGNKVRYVLFWSTGLAVLAMILMFVATHFGLFNA